ncbi:MAG: Uma2 family endonuclease [Thiomargarita sp.]|nr:Uma2 family endonuclease [Thiomargarita sp.]
MSDTYHIEYNAIDGEDEMGSLNHSTVQTNLAGLLKFKSDKTLFVMTELSLDVSQHDLSKYHIENKEELKPDICAYFTRPIIPFEEEDLLKVAIMPDLVIEILSPRQAINYLLKKTKVYFTLGVKSCWLVIPATRTINVYSDSMHCQTFTLDTAEVVDENTDIRLPMSEIFE